MSYKTIEFHVRGAAPLLMHNGHLADPMNKFARELKKVTGKRKKTDEDYEEMARIEFLGSLYTDEKGAPCIPGELLEANIIDGAKKTRAGKVAKSAIIVDGAFPLIYEGPKEVDKLVKNDNFRHVAGVKVGQARVMRTRPKFNNWELKFKVHYLPGVLNEQEIVEFVKAAGTVSGLGDNRPRFGRYDIVETSATAA